MVGQRGQRGTMTFGNWAGSLILIIWPTFLSANSTTLFEDQAPISPQASVKVRVAKTLTPDGVDAGSDEPFYLKTFKTHSRISFRVDPGVVTQWKNTPGGFELLFKDLTLTDLGAPLGGESEFVKELTAKRDTRLASLSFKETDAGLLVIGRWIFVQGENGPDQKIMERFDYRQKDPSRYVVDFWVKPGPTVAEARIQRKRDAERALLSKIDRESRARRERRIASERARQALEETTPFCKAPLSPATDVFLAFNPAHKKFDPGAWFPLTTPDWGYSYLSPKGASKEAQYVRLALELYKMGNFGLTIKTLDFLKVEVPNSIYATEMKFLRANALIKLGSEPQALHLLKDIVESGVDSRATIHSAMYLAKMQFERAEYLMALEQFLWLGKRYPNHQHNWVFHFGAAESLYMLRHAERARAEYEMVIKKASQKKYQAQAASRIGDLYMMRGQYDRAIASYFEAIRKYDKEIGEVPLVHINRAESLFWMGQLDRAAEEFKKFITQYPSNPFGWRAAFRLGEIYGRYPLSDQNQIESRKWFLNTINQYPHSPGAVLARLRLLSCGDHGGFSPEIAEGFLEGEAAQFTGNDEVYMRNYRDFRGLIHMRTLIAFKDYDRALDVGIRELQANSKSEARLVIGDTLRALFRKCILRRLDQGKNFDALTFFHEKVGSIPKSKGPGEPVPSDFLLSLARAASDLGLGGKSEQLVAKYREAQAIEAEIDRKVASEDIEIRLKKSEEAYTSAKGIWISEGLAGEVKIKQALAQVIEESPYSYEKEVLLSIIADRSKQHVTALKHAKNAQSLLPSPNGGPGDPEVMVEALRIRYWVARLESIAGDSALAQREFKAIAQLATDEVRGGSGIRSDSTFLIGLTRVPGFDQLTLSEGEILERRGKWGEAALAYSRAVEKGQGGNQLLYAYAKALEKTEEKPNQEKSRSVMEQIAESEKDDFWRKLARTMLADEQTGKYKPKKQSTKEGGK